MDNWLNEICEMIEIPKEIASELKHTEKDISGLLKVETSEAARSRLMEEFESDERGVKMLGCMLQAMETTKKNYEEKGISEEIFIETMKCFTRFINEHKASYGHYGFDRAFWTSRQLSMNLFRIGELEYELYTHESEPCIGIHIPSDAILTVEKCSQSIEEAQNFFRQSYPEALNRDYYCHSWLLSPALDSLLPQDSNILNFQKRFKLINWEKDNDSYLEWVFKRKDLSLEALPQETSLQQKMKQHLLNGEKIGAGLGKSSWIQLSGIQ